MIIVANSISIESQVARAEAYFIANTDNQYLVPTSGKPLRGLIQDHVVAGMWMTAQDAFFNREEYFQLLYGAVRPEDTAGHISGRLVTLPPTIWKPQPLWTGKQIVSHRFWNTWRSLTLRHPDLHSFEEYHAAGLRRPESVCIGQGSGSSLGEGFSGRESHLHGRGAPLWCFGQVRFRCI